MFSILAQGLSYPRSLEGEGQSQEGREKERESQRDNHPARKCPFPVYRGCPASCIPSLCHNEKRGNVAGRHYHIRAEPQTLFEVLQISELHQCVAIVIVGYINPVILG